MFKTLIFIILLLSCDDNMKPKDKISNEFNLEDLSKDSIYSYMKTFSDFGIKSVATSGNLNTRNWIISKLTSWGYSPTIHEFPISNTMGKNIIAVKEGSNNSNKYIIVDGHYDSVTSGPGANDNGSGVSIILEIARLFSEIDIEETVHFIFFDAEENGLIGSTAYANKIKADGDSLLFLLNIDMVGGHKDMSHWKIVCEEDQNGHSGSDSLSHDYNMRLINAVKKYTTLDPVIDITFGSDYVRFEQNGYTVIGLYEYNGQHGNPTYHRSSDIFDNVHPSYAYQVARGAISFLISEVKISD